MKRIPLIKNVMTPFPYTISRDAGAADAEAVMHRHDIRHVPVVDGERLVSVVTERDLRLYERLSGPGLDDVSVGDLAVGEALLVDFCERLDRVLERMERRHVDSALVVKQGRLVGILTMGDCYRILGQTLRDLFAPPDGNDAA